MGRVYITHLKLETEGCSTEHGRMDREQRVHVLQKKKDTKRLFAVKGSKYDSIKLRMVTHDI